MSCCCTFLSILTILAILVLLIKLFLHKIPNNVKLFLFNTEILILAIIFVPFMVFRPKDYRNLLIPFSVLRYCAKFIGFQIEIRGRENIEKDKGNVIIMNHQSTLDLLMLAHVWPLLGSATIVVKKSLLFYPFFGAILWLSGFLFINRKKQSKAINMLNEESRAIKEKKFKLLIFPEGTRTLTENLLPFKKGAFFIATQNQCKIQPIVTSHFKFLKSKVPTNTNHIIVSILPAISTNYYQSDDKVNELVKKCRDIMQRECVKITQESGNYDKKAL